MNSTPLLFLGILVALASSWWGILVAPSLQVGNTPTILLKETGQHYPPNRPGLAQQGAAIYLSEGCNTCHSQLVRPEGFGIDLARGWGKRRTVAQDYLRDSPVLLGTVRIGPDLTNIGYRMGAGDTNAQPVMVAYHLKHLYHPRTVAAGSVMPAYPYLFEQRPIVAGALSPHALKLEGAFAPPAGYEIVPKPEATALVAYLLSLRSGISLAEAPIPQPPTNGVDTASASTNGMSAASTATPTNPTPAPPSSR